VDFELAAIKALREIFWKVSIKYYIFHLVHVWWGQIQKYRNSKGLTLRLICYHGIKIFSNFVDRVLTCYWNYKPYTISKSGAWTQYWHNLRWKKYWASKWNLYIVSFVD
jgi:hypothetical protein